MQVDTNWLIKLDGFMQTFGHKCPHASHYSKENVVVLFLHLKLVDLGSHYYPGSVACFNM